MVMLTLIGRLRAIVDDALSVMDVTVIGSAACILGVARVRNIYGPETGATLEAALGSNSVDHIDLLVGDQVVRGTKAIEVGG